MKAVIYARVSSRLQEETGYSLPAQEQLSREYAERKDLEIVKVFSVAESASGKKEREVFRSMIDYMTKNKINHLLCEKVDRLTRNLKEAVMVNEWIDSNEDREIHFVKTHLVISKNAKSDEKFRWDIEIVLAKKYISNLSEEVKKGQKEKIAQGWLPTKPPLGYKTVGEKGHKIHVIDKAVAPFIVTMFELYATGNYSTKALVEEMYARGLRNRNGNKVGKSRIYDLLVDPFYYGDFRWKTEIYSGKQEPLISKELFKAVQNKLNRKIITPYYSKHLPVFKGKIKCENCHRTITWEKQKGNWYGGCKSCKIGQGKTKYMRQEKVEEQLLQRLVEVAPRNERILNILEKALREDHKQEREVHTNKIKSLQLNIDRLQNRIEAIYEDKLDGLITPEQYQTRLKMYSSEKSELLRQHQKLEEDNTKYYEAGFAVHELACRAKEIYLSTKAQTEERRLLMSYAFSNLTLSQGKLKVKYTPAFEFLAKWMPRLNEGFELHKTVVPKGQKLTLRVSRPTLLDGMSDIRTALTADFWRRSREALERAGITPITPSYLK